MATNNKTPKRITSCRGKEAIKNSHCAFCVRYVPEDVPVSITIDPESDYFSCKNLITKEGYSVTKRGTVFKI